MDAVFLKILNMSILAGWLILAAILLRLLFKKALKWMRCVLWTFVAIRLVCPFSLESIFSLIPSPETVNPEILYSQGPAIISGNPAFNNAVNPIINETCTAKADAIANPLQSITQIASFIWIAGIAGMLLYAAICYLRLRRKVKISMPLKENIWLCDTVGSPFILGIIKPRIYLPSNMAEEQINLAFAHENAHLKRRDHIWKPFGYLLLAVYWFHPLCWLAYWLLCRDIEFACDEKVTKDLDRNGKKAYAEALLSCSVNHRTIAACPLAFGEAGVKVRVKSVLRYRKPAFWVILAAITACLITAVCLLTNPAGIKIAEIKQFQGAADLLKDVAHIEIQNGNTFCTITSRQEIEKVLRQIDTIRIYKNPVSQNRSEDRDQTNRIVLQYHNNFYKTIYFNESCNALWVNDGIKPTLTYQIKKPDDARRLFAMYGSTSIEIAGQDAEQTESAYLSYIYAGSNEPFFYPAILLHQKGQTFQFTDSVFSSYITIGAYELTDTTLTLRTYDGTRVYVFGVNQKNNSFIFDAGKSYGMPTYGAVDRTELRPMIPDGAEFIAGSWWAPSSN